MQREGGVEVLFIQKKEFGVRVGALMSYWKLPPHSLCSGFLQWVPMSHLFDLTGGGALNLWPGPVRVIWGLWRPWRRSFTLSPRLSSASFFQTKRATGQKKPTTHIKQPLRERLEEESIASPSIGAESQLLSHWWTWKKNNRQTKILRQFTIPLSRRKYKCVTKIYIKKQVVQFQQLFYFVLISFIFDTIFRVFTRAQMSVGSISFVCVNFLQFNIIKISQM